MTDQLREQVQARPRKRMTLEFPASVREMMDELKEETNSHSVTHLILRSLVLFGEVYNHAAKGGIVIFRAADGTEERIKFL